MVKGVPDKRNKTKKPTSNRGRKYDTNESKMGDSKIRTTAQKCNDPAWYVREGQIAKDVASLSFNNAIGARTFVSVDNPNGSWTGAALAYGLPGIMAIQTVPAMGIAESAASPLNIAAKNLYSFVRHANSGSKNYDSPDLMLYVLGMDSIYSAIIHMQRAYATALVTSQVNRFVGDGLLLSMGFDPASVRSNLAQFRAQINMLIVKASAFCVPNTMSLFKRHAWMYSTVYRDTNLTKSKFYLYRPIGLFQYQENTGGAGKLKLVPCAAYTDTSTNSIKATSWTAAAWVSNTESLLNALVASEDINIMSGDILKAYGRENLYTLAFVPEDAQLEVAYSEEILDQIHNTVFIGGFWRNVLDLTDATQVSTFSTDSFDVYQDTTIGDGHLMFRPQVMGARHLGMEKVLDMYDEQPTPERVLVATRNMVQGSVDIATDSSGTSVTIATLTSAGSDLCVFACVYDHYIGPGGQWQIRMNTYFMRDGSLALQAPNTDDLMAFHRAPMVYVFNGSSLADLAMIAGEIDNFNVVSGNVINKIHESAILSMLGVPV